MARVNCTNCGTERIVPEGKIKNCRKCGEKLTSSMKSSPKVEMTEQKLRQLYPNLIEKIETEAIDAFMADQAESDITAEMINMAKKPELEEIAVKLGIENPARINKPELINLCLDKLDDKDAVEITEEEIRAMGQDQIVELAKDNEIELDLELPLEQQIEFVIEKLFPIEK